MTWHGRDGFATSAGEEYVALKRRLLVAYEHDRDAYTAAKTDFIRRCVKKARSEEGMPSSTRITEETAPV
jgi:hypothetical protein